MRHLTIYCTGATTVHARLDDPAATRLVAEIEHMWGIGSEGVVRVPNPDPASVPDAQRISLRAQSVVAVVDEDADAVDARSAPSPPDADA